MTTLSVPFTLSFAKSLVYDPESSSGMRRITTKKPARQPTLLLILVLSSFLIYADTAIKADPDHVCSGVEYSGKAAVKIGDYLAMKHLQTGGFIEVRNENNFNTKFFPNHNWRGHFFLYASFFTEHTEGRQIYISAGFKHESAHPTMGIRNSKSDAYTKIYDDVFRNINLNSLLVRYNRERVFEHACLAAIADYQLYFFSNNTPELPGNTSAISNGLSFGLEYTRALSGPINFYVSLFDRYIFESKKHETDSIYFGNGADCVKREASWPVINEVNTLTAKTGLMIQLEKINRQVEVYCRVLYGNIFGFVDSRDKRFRVAGGVCVSR